MELLKPSEIRTLRNDYGISVIEVAAMCGLPADFIRQIEDHEVAALDTDLERIVSALRTIIQERCRRGGREKKA